MLGAEARLVEAAAECREALRVARAGGDTGWHAPSGASA